ncbi:MAG: hypothetical protein R3B72_11305 [Polyangiaceae bacterium]
MATSPRAASTPLLFLLLLLATGCDDNPLEGILSVEMRPRWASVDLTSSRATDLAAPPGEAVTAPGRAMEGGRVFLFGGITTDFGTSGAVSIYDRAAGTWSQGAPMPNPRAKTRAAVVDDLVCLGAGVTAGLAEVAAFDCYDTASDAWIDAAWSRGPVHHPVALAGSIYAFNGSPMSPQGQRAGRFDPTTKTWEDLAPTPKEAVVEWAVVAGDSIFAVTMANELWSYAPATDAWSVVGDTPIRVDYDRVRSLFYGGELFVMDAEDQGWAALDPSASTWRVIDQPYPTGSLEVAAGDDGLVAVLTPKQKAATAPVLRSTPTVDAWEERGQLEPRELPVLDVEALFLDGPTALVLANEVDDAFTLGR